MGTTISEIVTKGEFGDYKLIFGKDGSGNWRPILVDSSGNVQMVLTNLEKAEDVAHASGDKGIMGLAVRKDDVGSLCGADGDYTPLILNEHGILRTQAQQHYHIDECDAITGWTVLGNDTINLAVTTNHVAGQYALEFDKVDGAANTKIAGIQKTITSFDFTPYHKGGGFALCSCYLSSLTSVDYCFLRLGTDNSNYTEWRCDADDLEEGWNFCRHTACKPSATVGNGWNSAAITYVAVGVAFEAETDELADIAVDHLAVNTGLMTSIPVEAAKNINLLKIKNKVVDVGVGDAGTGTQRISVANESKSFRNAAGDGRRMLVDAERHGQVDIITSGLPTGAATSAKQLADGHNVTDEFGGAAYENYHTMVDNNAYRFEAAEKKLRDINITIEDEDAVIGDSSNQRYPLKVGEHKGFTKIDLSTLYIKNAVNGSNTTVIILGVEE